MQNNTQRLRCSLRSQHGAGVHESGVHCMGCFLLSRYLGAPFTLPPACSPLRFTAPPCYLLYWSGWRPPATRTTKPCAFL